MKQFIHPVSCTMTTQEAEPAKTLIFINLSAARTVQIVPVPTLWAENQPWKGNVLTRRRTPQEALEVKYSREI